jgi:hypothetical protein
MNFVGIVSSVLLVFLCWPACFFPACFGCSYSGYQVPVYE